VGVGSSAERLPCEPCDGTGRFQRVNWGTVWGILLCLLVMAGSLMLIVWSAESAFGHEALYVYYLGPWQIGPFTDLGSCEQARQFQLAWGVPDVSACQILVKVID
jgi:hypothetical protein